VGNLRQLAVVQSAGTGVVGVGYAVQLRRSAGLGALEGNAEIRGMLEAVARSTSHLRDAGFDGVMLHASHGGMIEQFVSPYFNQRTDDYGGSFGNRMRFLRESLQAAREAAGGGIAVGMRLNCDELLPGGYGTSDAREILSDVAGRGLIDFVDLDVAVEPNQLQYGMPPVFVPPQVYRPFVEKVRSAAGSIPVLSVLGRTTAIADAEAALESGVVDMIGATRSLIAEPELVKNAWYGRERRSRTCIACNWCLMAGQEGGAQGCTINPASYRERRKTCWQDLCRSRAAWSCSTRKDCIPDWAWLKCSAEAAPRCCC
jgi:2,4-dienoyl-CoA reductase-like NADH-dependent reductase (Old Yellow Enzyme family)